MQDKELDKNTIYEIISFDTKTAKTGQDYGILKFKNLSTSETSEPFTGFLWNNILNNIEKTGNRKILVPYNKVKLDGKYNEERQNYTISGVELVEKSKYGIGLSKEQQDEIFNNIFNYVNKITDKKLAEFVSTLLFEHENEFKKAPAANKWHHNYLGGLLEHTYECLDIAETILPKCNNKINPDIVYAACILHDFGKIFEYDIDEETGTITYQNEFKKDWRTHSQWGFSICMNKGFKDIAKMIAAHHGRTDWGAVIDLGDLDEKDAEPFMYILHHIDDLSAKFGKISIADIKK